MIVKQHSARSFQAVSDYLLHDKQARTEERVEWSHAQNVWSEDVREAWQEMAVTVADAPRLKRESGASPAGRRVRNAAFHLSLSWAQDENPSREDMLEAGRDALKALGLDKHQALFVCHNDEPHPHVHILVNRIDRETGRANKLAHSKRKLQDWALAYERDQGHIRCQLREENNAKLKHGERPRYDDPAIRTAWERSDTGKAFQAALAERGYTLAMGNRRIVVVDPHGKAINPARELHGVKAAQIKARLADIDLSALPRAEDVRRQREDEQQRGDQGRAAAPQARAEERTVGKENGGAGAASGAQADTAAQAAERERESAKQGREPPVTETTNLEKAPGEGAQTAKPVKETPAIFDRDRYQVEWEKALVEAAIRAEQERAARARAEKVSGGRDDSAREHVKTQPRTPEQEKERFEAWANRKRAELQSLLLDEDGEVGTRHARAREVLAERLKEEYGGQQRRERTRAAEASARIERGGLLYRMSGQEERDRKLVCDLARNRRDREQRIEEARGTLEVRLTQEREAMTQRHAQRSAALEQRIAQARARREAEGWSPNAGRPANDQPRRGDEERAREREQATDVAARLAQERARQEDVRRGFDERFQRWRETLESALARQQGAERARLERTLEHIRSGRIKLSDPAEKEAELQRAIEHTRAQERQALAALEQAYRERRHALEAVCAQREQAIRDGHDPAAHALPNAATERAPAPVQRLERGRGR